MPLDVTRLNSYMIQGTKSLDCDCDADELDRGTRRCTHWLKTAEDPTLCEHPWVIRAFTARSTWLSLVETLIIAAELTGDSTFTHDAEGSPFFGRATVFISYFWHSPFKKLVDAIGNRHEACSYYWIDILNVAQCRHEPKAVAWNRQDMGKFSEAIAAAGAQVWLHCEPWYRPKTLHRVWCLDEIVASIDTAKGFIMMLAAEEEAGLEATLATRFDDVLAAFAEVDAIKANATHESDKVMIFARIERRKGGFRLFNATIVNALREWLLRTARGILQRSGGVVDAGLLSGLRRLELHPDRVKLGASSAVL
jgi:hypothetical protein